jgi:hypothetical protein
MSRYPENAYMYTTLCALLLLDDAREGGLARSPLSLAIGVSVDIAFRVSEEAKVWGCLKRNFYHVTIHNTRLHLSTLSNTPAYCLAQITKLVPNTTIICALMPHDRCNNHPPCATNMSGRCGILFIRLHHGRSSPFLLTGLPDIGRFPVDLLPMRSPQSARAHRPTICSLTHIDERRFIQMSRKATDGGTWGSQQRDRGRKHLKIYGQTNSAGSSESRKPHQMSLIMHKMFTKMASLMRCEGLVLVQGHWQCRMKW